MKYFRPHAKQSFDQDSTIIKHVEETKKETNGTILSRE